MKLKWLLKRVVMLAFLICIMGACVLSMSPKNIMSMSNNVTAHYLGKNEVMEYIFENKAIKSWLQYKGARLEIGEV